MAITKFKVLLACPNPAEIELGVNQLRQSGFLGIHAFVSFSEVKSLFYRKRFDLAFIDDIWDGEYSKAIDLLYCVKTGEIDHCKTVILTSNPTYDRFYLYGMMGVFDYLIKSPELHLGEEAVRVLGASRRGSDSSWDPESILDFGFFRTLGLTGEELEILAEYMRGFPTHSELSSRIGKSPPKLREVFLNIYRKLEPLAAIDNLAQLAHLLTIGALYRATKPDFLYEEGASPQS